jgi:hypothetical protein
MIKRLILICLLFSINRAAIFCQQSDYLRGKVIDSKTSEPIPFATVRLKNSQVGVISNAEGDFRILNNSAFQSDSLMVSSIGFQKLSVAFSKLKKTEMNNLELVAYTYNLKEVSVTAKKRRLDSKLIIARAFNNIKKNYPIAPFSYVSYYRDYLKDSVNYLNLNEAIIQTLDNGFANGSDSIRYKLLNFKKNADFKRIDMTPNYDLPETDHSDVKFKKIPFAKVGDQYGNELLILLVHDAIRNFDKDSFSFVDTLTVSFLRNHWFSLPVGVYQGRTLLYKIDFVNKYSTSDNVKIKGSIYIQPEDYSIHKFEYIASYIDSEKKNKEIYKIDIEYGHQPTNDNKMMLKYISFNNLFTIPDLNDDDTFFRLEKLEWEQIGGPYNSRPPYNMNIIAYFNRKIDRILGERKDNYELTVGKRIANIKKVMINGYTMVISIRDDSFKSNELDSCHLNIRTMKDINGNILNKHKGLEFRQFRELFVQEYNKSLEYKNNCFIQPMPLEKNCISIANNAGMYWMNTPLKDEEKKQDSEILK